MTDNKDITPADRIERFETMMKFVYSRMIKDKMGIIIKNGNVKIVDLGKENPEDIEKSLSFKSILQNPIALRELSIYSTIDYYDACEEYQDDACR